MSPWICVVGGGRSQVPFIEAAHVRGLDTIVFDRDAAAPAAAIATEFVAMSTHDTSGVLDHLQASGRDLVGCFTYSSFEAALTTTAAIVDRYRLPGLTGVAVSRTSSKLAMRRHLDEAGVPVPSWIHTDSAEELRAFAERLGRVVVKPARGGVGSTGVASIDGADPGEVLRRACQASSDGSALAESFVDGDEFSVDGYVVRGEVRVVCTSRKHTGVPGAPHVMAGFVAGDLAVRQDLERLATTTVAALALDNTYFSLDVIASGDELFVIDAGPLLDAKIDRLLHLAGVDVYGIASDIALGEVAAGSLPGGWHALRFVYAERPGLVAVAAPGRAGDAVVELEREVGDEVAPPTSVSDILGWAYAAGPEPEALWGSLGALDLTGHIEVGDTA